MKHLLKKKWWMLFVTTSGASLILLDNTIMPVALPSIQREMNLSAVNLIWIVNAYLLALTAFLLIGGRLCDLFGKRFLFNWGLSLFGLGSLIGGLSWNGWSLIMSRIVQGIGGALTIPTVGALLIATFDPGERAKAIGINTGISSIFLILGPVIGGFLSEYVGWRSIFFINIPIVIFGIIMAFALLKKEKRKHETFHFTGALVMLIGVTSLVVGLMEASSWGWSSPLTLSLIVLGILFLSFFVWISTHVRHPIIHFHLFHNRLFTAANLSLLITQIILMVTVWWAIYFQSHLNYSPVQTGMLIFASAFPVFFMAPLGGYLADQFGPRLPIVIGFAFLFLGLIWLILTAGNANVKLLLPGLLSFGCGLAIIMSPAFALALSQSKPEQLGAAAGITTTTRQLASTIGIAVMTAIYDGIFHTTQSHTKAFSAISIVATCCAVGGFLVGYLLIKKKDHLRTPPQAQSRH